MSFFEDFQFDEVGFEDIQPEPLSADMLKMAMIVADCSTAFYRIAAECDEHAVEIAKRQLVRIQEAMDEIK